MPQREKSLISLKVFCSYSRLQNNNEIKAFLGLLYTGVVVVIAVEVEAVEAAVVLVVVGVVGVYCI